MWPAIIGAGLFALIGSLIWALVRKSTKPERDRRERAEEDTDAANAAADRRGKPVDPGAAGTGMLNAARRGAGDPEAD